MHLSCHVLSICILRIFHPSSVPINITVSLILEKLPSAVCVKNTHRLLEKWQICTSATPHVREHHREFLTLYHYTSSNAWNSIAVLSQKNCHHTWLSQTQSGALALAVGVLFLLSAFLNVVLPHYERVSTPSHWCPWVCLCTHAKKHTQTHTHTHTHTHRLLQYGMSIMLETCMHKYVHKTPTDPWGGAMHVDNCKIKLCKNVMQFGNLSHHGTWAYYSLDSLRMHVYVCMYACVCYTAMRRVYLILTSARGMCACKRADKKFHSCAYTHACTCVCVCMCVCLCACVCVCVCVYVLVCAHVYEYAYTHKPVFDSVCTHIHTLTVQTQIHIHTKQWGLCVYVTAWCVYVCIFMHIHTYM